METMMKMLIFEYLEYVYEVNFTSLINYTLVDKQSGGVKSVHDVTYEIEIAFDVTTEELRNVFCDWVESKSTHLNNAIVDMQIKMYSSTGQVPRQMPMTNDGILELIRDMNTNIYPS